MKIDPSKAIGAYAAVATGAALWFALAGAQAVEAPTKLGVLDVERINIRERDGTLRMVIAGKDRIGGLVIGDTEYPHPNRTQAGMIFYNDEGTENGGLVFDGAFRDGKPTNSGHLSFDRWRQDQTLYFQSLEEGERRRAGVFVQDRPDQPLDLRDIDRIRALPDGDAKDRAYQAAGFDDRLQRAFLGRDFDDASKLVLRDGQGRPRLRLTVESSGVAAIQFLDASGRVTRTVASEAGD